MAPKPAMKRMSNASPVGSPGKKGRKVDPVAQKVEGIAAELAASHDIPNGPHVAKMLAGFAQAALRTPKEARHPYQTEAVDMIGKSLKGIEEAISKRVVDLQARSDGADNERKARGVAREEAEKALVALRGATAEAEKIFSEDSVAVTSAKIELNKALTAQKNGDRDLDQAEAEKKDIDAVIAENLIPLKEMGAEGKLGKAGIKALEKAAKQIGVEDSLLKGFPRVLAKQPADRSDFDNTMVTSLADEFQAYVGKLATTLEEGRPGKEERAATVEAAKGVNDAAVAKRDESKAKQKEANVALKTGQTKLENAEEKVANFFPDMKALMDGLDAEKKRLAAFRSGIIADFESLKELEPVKEPEPEVVEAAEVAEVEEPAKAEEAAAEVPAPAAAADAAQEG